MDWHISVLASAESTQDVLKQRAAQGAPEGTAIQALMQTSGRGRHGNSWDSPMGNLYLSVLFRPHTPPDQTAQMAFVTALALSRAMDEYLDVQTIHAKKLKWPNDILINGLKVSGILLETALGDGEVTELYVGMGVNILAPPDGRAGLHALANKPIYVNVFRDRVLFHLGDLYECWVKEGFAPIRASWLAQAYGMGQEITVRLPEVTLTGIFQGLDDQGFLQLAQGDKVNIIRSGDVHFGKA
ncbi:MAG: biotin--[acetyl-CoA-carboxylase] ligase [Alphaproteobacteria bacterium]|nr:biotin--[acetyl-CoA-carboxylase] ligase [Alphaproteobacteria bacterium]